MVQAARSGATECGILLLSWGADVNPVSKDQSTPLHLAARYNHSEAIDLFNYFPNFSVILSPMLLT